MAPSQSLADVTLNGRAGAGATSVSDVALLPSRNDGKSNEVVSVCRDRFRETLGGPAVSNVLVWKLAV